MKILFRTCGGLGNQIFQFFYLACVRQKFSCDAIIHHHSTNYNRFADFEFPVHEELELIKPNLLELTIISLRIPTILRRIGFKRLGYLKLGNFIIIDGYFQSEFDYCHFSRKILRDSISEIRERTVDDTGDFNRKKRLIHLRLGDYLRSPEMEFTFILGCLNSLNARSSDVMSNNDSLFRSNSAINLILNKNNQRYIYTSSCTARQLYNIFCEYDCIVSTGSSLSFAACIFNNGEIIRGSKISGLQEESFERLNKLKDFLIGIQSEI